MNVDALPNIKREKGGMYKIEKNKREGGARYADEHTGGAEDIAV